MRTYIIPFFLLLILLTGEKAQGQNNTEKKELIQFSGVLVTGDSLKNVPYGNTTPTSSRYKHWLNTQKPSTTAAESFTKIMRDPVP